MGRDFPALSAKRENIRSCVWFRHVALRVRLS